MNQNILPLLLTCLTLPVSADTYGNGQEASARLAAAQLSGRELEIATDGMGDRLKSSESGQRIEWLGTSRLPKELARERAFEIVSVWTERDYSTAGNWLNSPPDSPEKSAAVGAFAATACPHDPKVAIQWLQTLPQGSDRAKALETRYQGTPRNSDAAKTFASEHGITK